MLDFLQLYAYGADSFAFTAGDLATADFGRGQLRIVVAETMDDRITASHETVEIRYMGWTNEVCRA
jgi:hypothetical protein